MPRGIDGLLSRSLARGTRGRVQHLANRLVYGRRAIPYEVLAEFAGRIGGSCATEDLLPRMARILAEGTGAARADVWLRTGDGLRNDASWPPGAEPFGQISMNASGDPESGVADRIAPVRFQGQVLGALSVSKRPGETLSATEGRLLTGLAGQAGIVLRNAGLWEELTAALAEVRASRQRLVAAQDSERRRIERGIHDGAQQHLVALAIKLSITESVIGTDPQEERELLAGLRSDVVGAIEELRALARGIYPPLLAGGGLAAALRALAARSPLRTVVEAAGTGRYPQDVEAAVYFCVLEALRNVARHAGASCARVRLAAPGNGLSFEVTDDGHGFDPAASGYGGGLQGMADRLSALGGTLSVRSRPGAGTAVTGWLPVRVTEVSGYPAGSLV